jgi:hypothetical protein
MVLSLLEEVATDARSARLVRVGHECMELIITEFLPSLGREQLRRTLHVEACYVLQRVEVNTCYSASLTLWRAADSLGCALQLINRSGTKFEVCCCLQSVNAFSDVWRLQLLVHPCKEVIHGSSRRLAEVLPIQTFSAIWILPWHKKCARKVQLGPETFHCFIWDMRPCLNLLRFCFCITLA